MKTMSFNQMKRQEAQSRMAAIRRASLVGDEAQWRITNLNEVARAIAKWK
jgi:hypothetical protein